MMTENDENTRRASIAAAESAFSKGPAGLEDEPENPGLVLAGLATMMFPNLQIEWAVVRRMQAFSDQVIDMHRK